MQSLLQKSIPFSEYRKIVLQWLIEKNLNESNLATSIQTLHSNTKIDKKIILIVINELVSNGFAKYYSNRDTVVLTKSGITELRYIINDDSYKYSYLLKKAKDAKIKIETGFIELAESVKDIHDSRLYRVKYKTFENFCETELGFSRQTVYVYLAILKLIINYPSHFPKERAIQFGHKKMRYITEGVSSIEKKIEEKPKQEKVKKDIFKKIKPEMPASSIKKIIDTSIKNK